MQSFWYSEDFANSKGQKVGEETDDGVDELCMANPTVASEITTSTFVLQREVERIKRNSPIEVGTQSTESRAKLYIQRAAGTVILIQRKYGYMSLNKL